MFLDPVTAPGTGGAWHGAVGTGRGGSLEIGGSPEIVDAVAGWS